MIPAVDLFAGCGWSFAARELGIDELGIDLDAAVCAVRRELGMRTLQADIAALDPLDFAPCELLIASPPCTAFSTAGKGKGRDALGAYATQMQHMARGWSIDRDWLDSQCDDATAHLVLEPLRWALALEPSLIACEQVPSVLPLWNLMGDMLRERGYSCWSGTLDAERYGVPQTRNRAIFMASNVGMVHPPLPTHQQYVFGEPQRHEVTFEGELLPWVSMAEALAGLDGWPEVAHTHTHTAVVASSDRQRGRDSERGRGGVRQGWPPADRAFRLARGTGMIERYGERPDTPVSEPAPVIGPMARTATWEASSEPSRAVYVNGNQPNSAQRDATEPAPTVLFGHRSNDVRWYDRRTNSRGPGGTIVRSASVPDTSPAPTITPSASSRDVWTTERPATTLAGDPRVFQPGGHHERGEQSANSIRVTVEEAAVLQSFPVPELTDAMKAAGISKTASFRIIGNAYPPLMAKVTLVALLATLGDK